VDSSIFRRCPFGHALRLSTSDLMSLASWAWGYVVCDAESSYALSASFGRAGRRLTDNAPIFDLASRFSAALVGLDCIPSTVFLLSLSFGYAVAPGWTLGSCKRITRQSSA
jgi:hypothetical protein